MPQPGKLKLVSRTAFNEFRELKEPSSTFLESLGLKSTGLEPTQKRLLAAAEILEIRESSV